jgi:type III restriction enzyme
MLGDISKAKIVITNYHAFRRRGRMELSKAGRALLQGRGPELNTLETEGEMLRRAIEDLMGLKNIVVLSDEAHHCYREKPQAEDGTKLKDEEKEEAKKNNEAARLWISGIETVKRKLGLGAVYDLSATPFFLRGSGYAEGTLFPWTVSDFSLMDAIESGIVKLPRVPVADNIPGGEMPKFRNLWENLRGTDLPKKGRGKAGQLDPLKIPVLLQTALEALYGHYAKTFALWEERGFCAARIHSRLPEHGNFENSLRLHLRLRPQPAGRHQRTGKRTAAAVPQLRRLRQPPAAPAHLADR